MTEPNRSAQTDDDPKLPPDFRLKPSRNQKRRSKLRQASEDSAPEAATPEPEPTPSTENEAAPPAVPLKKLRLKRSGHMHDDLSASYLKEETPPEKEAEY